jgi:8-oxo-dGTP pyrophosphatase MutT (NUDIX family)
VSLIEQLSAKLTPGEPPRPLEDRKNAAVAVLLHDTTQNRRDVPDDPRVLLMKRAERVGDPWSGHISLPGGRYQATDRHLLETAMRETREELGIDLVGARLLGHLPALHPQMSGPLGINVTPFVFVTDVAVDPVCGPEALEAFWLPLATAASGSLDAPYAYPNSEMTFPSWNFEGYVIWGLTWRILGDVLALAKTTP